MRRSLVWLTLAVVAGIGLAGLVRPHPALCLAIFSLALVGGGLAAVHGREGPGARTMATACLLLAALAAGGWRYSQMRHAGPGPLGRWLDRPVELVGTLAEVREGGGLWRGRLAVAAVRAPGGDTGAPGAGPAVLAGGAWAPVRGHVWVSFRSPPGRPAPALPGDGRRVAVAGVLVEPAGPGRPGEFDFREWLARQDVFLTLRAAVPPADLGPGEEFFLLRWARLARARLEGVLAGALPPEKAALLAGLVLGAREGIPVEWETSFRLTGTYHILAASGGNVALVVLPWYLLLTRLGLGRRRAALGAIPVVWAYCLLAGGDPPVARAAVMATVLFLARALDYAGDAYTALAAAALCLLAVAPGQLFDLGFQLSFAATLGILALARPLADWLGRWLAAPAAAPLSVTLAAGAAVEPLLLAQFGYVVLISPVANLWVALVAEVLIQAGLLGMLLGLAAPAAARLLLIPCGWGLDLLVRPVEWLSLVPGAFLPLGRVPLPWLLPWYFFLAAARWRGAPGAWRARAGALAARLAPVSTPHSGAGPQPSGRGVPRRRWWGRVAMAALMLAGLGGAAGAAAVAARPAAAPGHLLAVHFLDVGQGDAILLRFPGGFTALVDGGPAADRPGDTADAGRDVILPFLRDQGVDRLDLVVCTHPDQDHSGGLPAVVRALPVGEVWVSGAPGRSAGYRGLLAAAGAGGVPVHAARAGWRLEPAPGATLAVLHPPEVWPPGSNSRSVVLQVTYGATAFLLTGDIDAVAEQTLVAHRAPLQADVLKVAHHGSGSSSVLEFLDAVRPQIAVLSTGPNSFGHPDAGVLARLRRRGARVLRTDRHGTVSLYADGTSLRAAVSRHPWPEAAGHLVGAW